MQVINIYPQFANKVLTGSKKFTIRKSNIIEKFDLSKKVLIKSTDGVSLGLVNMNIPRKIYINSSFTAYDLSGSKSFFHLDPLALDDGFKNAKEMKKFFSQIGYINNDYRDFHGWFISWEKLYPIKNQDMVPYSELELKNYVKKLIENRDHIDPLTILITEHELELITNWIEGKFINDMLLAKSK